MVRKEAVPWNKGVEVGGKIPFRRAEVRAIKKGHKKRNNLKGLVIYSVAIDSSLRSGNLLSLKGEDVRSENGMIKQEIIITMEKTKKKVTFLLFADTRKALQKYMQVYQIEDDDYLFPGRFPKTHMSKESWRIFIKDCATMIGLNPKHYSAHSTRYTRPIYLTIKGVQDTLIAELMGIRIETLRDYLKRLALEFSKQYPM